MNYLQSNTPRLLSLKDEALNQIAQKQERAIWFADEVNYQTDFQNKGKLTPEQLKYLKQTLAFFAVSDALVLNNLENYITPRITNQDVLRVYRIQSMMEAVHQVTYTQLVDVYADSPEEAEQLKNAIDVKGLQDKVQFIEHIIDWMGTDGDEPSTLDDVGSILIGIFTEGLLFQSSFASIYYLQNKGHRLQGLYWANDKIATDEQMHTDFGIFLFHKLVGQDLKKYETAVRKLAEVFVIAEIEFIKNTIPVAMLGMNSELMVQYIRSVAANLVRRLGYEAEPVVNPFVWMETLGVVGRDNFFDTQASAYQKSTQNIGYDDIKW